MDADGDGHYTPDSCKTPNDDCNDNDSAVFPGTSKICDEKDNNCDGQVDEGCCYDTDGDGFFGISAYCSLGDDCNDNDSAIYPGATETCDEKDNNCDGQIDETCEGCSENKK